MSKIKFTWSLTVGSQEAAIGDAGKVDTDAVTKAAVSVAEGSESPLDLEHEDLENIVLLVVKSSDYSGEVSVAGSAADAPEVALTGPLVLYGAAVGLLGDSLATLTVKNGNDDAAVEIELLVGRSLANPP